MQKAPSSLFEQTSQISDDLQTVLDYVRLAISAFNQHDVYFGHGTENAWQEAHVLVFSALHLPLDLSAEEQQTFYPCRLTQEEKTLILAWIKARCEDAMPLAYLTNQAWFLGMPFYVDERVLIPRSPFAELIQSSFADYLPQNAPLHNILDMCTGSACIAIALAQQFEHAQIDAVDIDQHALDVASINIHEYQLEERVFPIQSDLFSALGDIKYDLIVVNPPYVDVEDMQDLPREYLHEPEEALASGLDGLELTHKILQQAHHYLADGAWLFIEVGNSEVNFAQRFGDFEVRWCDLKQGGSGIFAIQKEDLVRQLALLNKGS